MNVFLIDKYLLLSFIKKLINTLFVFVIIFLIVDIIEDIDKIIDNRVAFKDASMLYLYSIPQYINIAFPMSILISTVMTFTIFQQHNELTAFKAAGISVFRLTIPFILVGIISSISLFYFENLIVTKSTTVKSDLEVKCFKKGKKKQQNSNILIQLDKNRVASIEKFNHTDNVAKNVSIQKFQDNIMLSRLDIKKMKWNESSWDGEDVIYRTFSSKPIYYSISDTVLNLSIDPIDLIETNTDPDEMNYWALQSFINRLQNNGKEYNKWLVDLHFKVAFAFSNMLMVIFGIALSIQRPRSNLLGGIGASIFMIFLYYIMIKFGQTMGYKGIVNPMLSVWSANILFFVSGILLLYRTRT